MKHLSLGKKIGIIDLTRGELGTRGDAVIRAREAAAASKILGIKHRENLGFADGFFQNDKKHQLGIITVIRKYRPAVVFANAITDRHPDHGKAATLVADACFLSGLREIETSFEGKKQEAFRPRALYHYIQDRYIKPDFVVDISDFMEKKMKAINAFESQFYDSASVEPATYISSPHFLESIMARASEMGRSIGVRYAEGFTSSRIIGVEDVTELV